MQEIEQPKKRKNKPNCRYYTFWNELRIAKGVSVETVAKATELPQGALSTYFLGEHVPREYAARVLCDYFDVDYELGKSKFVEDHEMWEQRHSADWYAHDKQRESEYHKKYNQTNAIPICISFDRTKDRDLLDKLDTIYPRD